jgi:glycosyltransferase involved in cell wall biosynthesis
MNSKEMKSPMISVVIRSYNRLNHVLEIVQVCCTQTYENFEVVILDQSSDNHFKEYSPELNKLDSRFRVVHREPLGGTGGKLWRCIL